MSENRLDDYLEHMREAAVNAQNFVEGMNREDFLADRRTQQAVIMSILAKAPADCAPASPECAGFELPAVSFNKPMHSRHQTHAGLPPCKPFGQDARLNSFLSN